MNRVLRNLKSASAEFAAATRWYEEHRGGLGGEFYDEVSATTSRIEAHPEIGTPLSPDQYTRRLLVSRFPYQVVYRIRPQEIVVIAIAHLKRKPGYWEHRQ